MSCKGISQLKTRQESPPAPSAPGDEQTVWLEALQPQVASVGLCHGRCFTASRPREFTGSVAVPQSRFYALFSLCSKRWLYFAETNLFFPKILSLLESPARTKDLLWPSTSENLTLVAMGERWWLRFVPLPLPAPVVMISHNRRNRNESKKTSVLLPRQKREKKK